MGSLTPPWADELLSRNTKIARKMMSSMSTESYLLDSGGPHNNHHITSSPSPSPPQRPNRFLSVPVAHPSDPISTFSDRPSSSSSSSSPSSSSVPIINGESANTPKVVDPPTNTNNSIRMASSQSPISSPTTSFSSFRSNSNSSNNPPPSFSLSSKRNQQQQQLARNTEKLSPIRNERDSMFVDSEEESTMKGFEMTNGGGEDLSIIEYGPGIVKKLRSRYQSLALRQYTARPSLRRSASLENVLDAVSAEELAATLESKISNGHHNDIPDETSTRQTRPRNRFLPQNSSGDSDSRTGSPAPAESQQKQAVPESQQNGKSGGGTRGRTGPHDASARRDRMRRARSVDALHRTKREEEILEKFKHVVLPKEEIVIIEVSKPQLGGSNGNVFMENGNNINGSATNAEKRFPTRLLFTANNLRNSAGVLDQQTANRMRNLMISPEHELPPHDIVRETARIFEKNQENLNRRIGQALRLSKSASVSGLGSSPLQSPESPTPTQQKTVMAQSTTSSSAMQSQDKSFSTAAMANGPSSASSHGQKQIGIIKPTLSNSNGGVIISGNNVNSNKSAGSASAVNGGSGTGLENNRVRSPILSPIGFPNKPLLQNTQKPPLSPKPIFTSSPKVSLPEKGSKERPAVPLVTEPSPSTSPILIIDNRDNNRSLSPFKSESPIPRVKSPVSSSINKTTAAPLPSGGNNEETFMRSTSPQLSNGKASPDGDGGSKRLGQSQANNLARTRSPEGKEKEVVVLAKTNNKTVTTTPSSNLQNSKQGSSDHHRQQITKPSDQIPAPPPRSVSPGAPVDTTAPAETNSSSNSKQVSQLRVHQKQKSSKQGGNGSMVFNFTSRKEVPDYIEDDGLRRSSGGSQMGSGGDEGFSSLEKDSVDSKVIPAFEGANIIINGRSSIQKKPKSQKLSISFNESATTTHEYPSESSFAIEEEPSENENSAPKKPNVVTGSSSLGSYTPKTGGTNAYQLGSSYNTITFDGSSAGHNTKKSNSGNKQEEEENDFIEDYLKPNTESTTWSNEMSSDILF